MSLLSEGYNLAMNHYRQLLANQESINTIQNQVNSVTESTPTSEVSSSKENEKNNSSKTESSFDKLVTESIKNLTAGTTYNVGGYSISIPSLSDSNVQSRIKANNIDGIISMASEKYGVPEALIYKVIETESYFKTDSVSYVGATGLMQIMPFNNSSLGITDATDPYQNIMGGTKLLKQYLDMYDGDVKLGLAAYNAGPGNVNKYGGVPPFSETQNYVKKILGVNA